MRKTFLALLSAGALVACGQRDNQNAATDSASRDIQIPAAESTLALNDRPAPQTKTDTVFLPAPPPARTNRPAQRPPASPPAAPAPAPAPATPAPAPAPEPTPRAATLAAGTTIEAAATSSITSRTNKAGETFTAKIGEAIRSADGRVVIPAGADVTLSIVALKPAPNKAAKDGTIQLKAVSVAINGESRPIDAEVTYVQHTLKARGVTGSEAAKVGVGAAAGAIIGKVVGGGTGAAVGAVTGAAAGTAVAVETADRDVVVPVGGTIRLVLRSEF